MTSYNPHNKPDMANEADVMSRGRLVKVRFLDHPPPNVTWMWFPTGNCHACQHYARDRCTNPQISQEDFFDKYMFVNTCPGFRAGADPRQVADDPGRLDVMRAVGLVVGEPSQRVAVIYDAPWSMDAAERAHREQSTFLDMAYQADSGASNDPAHYNYVDMSDDLERQAAPESVAATLSTEATADHQPKTISVVHDWDTLRAIVVGRIDNDVFAPVPWQPSVEGLPKEGGVRYADFAPEEWERAIEQLDNLAKVLEKEGVTVYRPPLVPLEETMSPPVGLTQVYVREAFSVIGGTVVIGQCRTPYRRKESRALEPFFAAHPAVLRLPPVPDDVEDSLPDDLLPYIEGGDVFRLGTDALITLSGLATSPTGFRYVADALAEVGISAWPAYLDPKYEHGDYVLMLVREGLCVAHRRGFTDGLLPSPILDWDCVDITAAEADPGMGANGIVLRENVVVMPRGNPRVVRALERKGVDVIEVPFDGVAYFQGGIDCATCELWRG